MAGASIWAVPMLALWLTQTPSSPPSGSTEDVAAELRRAKNEYAYGNYDTAAKLLRGLLDPPRLFTDAQLIEARRYLGLSLYLLDEEAGAIEQFTQLLYLSPDYELDPFTVAPPIIELFEAVRTKHEAELDHIRTRLAKTQRERHPEANLKTTVTITRTIQSEWATFLPFGVGQFQNGDTAWGVGFAVAEATLLAINISSYLLLRAQRDDAGRPGFPARKAGLVQALTIAQFSTAALFGVTWSLGIFHARLRFQPEITKTREKVEPLGPTAPPAGLVLRIAF